MVVCAIVPTIVSADVIRLKNGNTVRGRIESRTADPLVIHIAHVGSVTIDPAEIDTIEDEPRTGAFTHVVHLKNGGQLYGAIERQSEQAVWVSLPGAGVVMFTNGEIASIQALSAEEVAAQEAALAQSKAAAKSKPAAPVHPPPSVARAPASDPDLEEMTAMQREIAAHKHDAQTSVALAQSLIQRVQMMPLGTVPGLTPDMAGRVVRNPLTEKIVERVFQVYRALGVWLWALLFLAAIYYAICLQRLAERTNSSNAWMAWVPILHVYLACQVGGKSGWWMLLYVVPFANLIIDVLVWMGIASARGKPLWLGLLVLFPILNLMAVGYLAFSPDAPEPRAAKRVGPVS